MRREKTVSLAVLAIASLVSALFASRIPLLISALGIVASLLLVAQGEGVYKEVGKVGVAFFIVPLLVQALHLDEKVRALKFNDVYVFLNVHPALPLALLGGVGGIIALFKLLGK